MCRLMCQIVYNIYMVWIYICLTVTSYKEVPLNVYSDLINFIGNQFFQYVYANLICSYNRLTYIIYITILL